MKTLITSNLVAIQLDDEDYDYFSQWCWYWHRQAATRNGRQHHINLHVEIMKRAGLYEEGKEVDHKNRIQTDNRRENLRMATHGQNGSNREATVGSTSQYKGVSWHRARQKWVAQIKRNKQVVFLGLFDNEIDAARKYNQVVKRIHGEFAVINEGID